MMKRRNIRAKELPPRIKSNRKKIAKQPGFWQSKALYMRILSTSFRWLCPCATALALTFLCRGADLPENVVLQYHFLGATQLAGNTNAATATKALTRKSTLPFEDLVFNRLSASLAAALHFQTSSTNVALLRPLLDDLVRAESLASMGGAPGKPFNYVVAVRLDPQRAQVWQQNLNKASGGHGEPLRADTFTGWQWNKGASDSFWTVSARDWMLVGRGGDLSSVRAAYLQQIQKTGRPAPALGANWFEAVVDWPRMASWFPVSSCPLRLGRTQIGISAEKGGLHMISKVTYSQPIQWHSQPWRIPTNLVRQPLVSFATGQDVEPFFKSDDTLAQLCTNPLRDQFYFWSMGMADGQPEQRHERVVHPGHDGAESRIERPQWNEAGMEPRPGAIGLDEIRIDIADHGSRPGQQRPISGGRAVSVDAGERACSERTMDAVSGPARFGLLRLGTHRGAPGRVADLDASAAHPGGPRSGSLRPPPGQGLGRI
jgi:hypothetical protein